MKITLAKTPDSVRNPKYVNKICSEKGCDIEFKGHPVRKYCDYHRDPKNRTRLRPIYDSITDCNRVIDHKYINSHDIEVKCMHEGCKNILKIRIHPKIYIYPKYCNDHKQKFKRKG